MYQLTANSNIKRLADGAIIPADPLNADYADFLAWLEDGNAPEAAPVLQNVPRAVTMRQARLALLQAGMLPTVNAAVAGMQGPAGDAARIEWEYSQEVQRDKALVLALAPVLGLSEAQLDALFVAASAL